MTRRQAAANVLKPLISSEVEAETTKIVGAWISNGLQSYTANPAENWKAKDSAVYLLGAIAAKGSTTLVSLSVYFTSNRVMFLPV
jgi:exportin-2 (importin alpha re-exporter)